jgi:hypothetical protein
MKILRSCFLRMKSMCAKRTKYWEMVVMQPIQQRRKTSPREAKGVILYPLVQSSYFSPSKHSEKILEHHSLIS